MSHNKGTCSIDDCTKHIKSRGFCSMHYERWRRANVIMPACAVPGCQCPSSARGYCATHYSRWNKYGNPVEPDHRFDDPDSPRRLTGQWVLDPRRRVLVYQEAS